MLPTAAQVRGARPIKIGGAFRRRGEVRDVAPNVGVRGILAAPRHHTLDLWGPILERGFATQSDFTPQLTVLSVPAFPGPGLG